MSAPFRTLALRPFLPVDAPLMLEHLKTAEEYEEGKHYILKVAGELGLTFA